MYIHLQHSYRTLRPESRSPHCQASRTLRCDNPSLGLGEVRPASRASLPFAEGSADEADSTAPSAQSEDFHDLWWARTGNGLEHNRWDAPHETPVLAWTTQS